MTDEPKTKKTSVLKALLFIPALALGIFVLVSAVKGREGPAKVPPEEKAQAVRIVEAPSVTVVPRALGYGNVQPGTTWEAVAEVAGKVIEVHPGLKKGAILPEGAVLLRIDPTEYRLAVAQIEANIQSVKAQIAELAVKEQNTRASLSIEERTLALSEKDLERKRKLLKGRNVSQASVDQEERAVLAQRQLLQNQRNTLNLLPAERQTLQAQLALEEAKLADAKLDLERTTLIAPFDCRVAEVRVERTQFAKSGDVLAEVDGLAVAEVSAQVPIDKMMTIVAGSDVSGLDAANAMAETAQRLALEPIVRLRAGAYTVEWPARLARISDTIDPETRTVGVIVAVDRPYGQMVAGERPPLTKNMFVEVELRGRAREGQVVVPRGAVHSGHVYLVGEDDRLVKRAVTVAFPQTNFTVIREGLSAGERVVVSDLIPAIEGMKLRPTLDPGAAEKLRAEAEGRGAVR